MMAATETQRFRKVIERRRKILGFEEVNKEDIAILKQKDVAFKHPER